MHKSNHNESNDSDNTVQAFEVEQEGQPHLVMCTADNPTAYIVAGPNATVEAERMA